METSSRSQNILHRIVEARVQSIAHRKRVLPEVALKIAVEKKVAPPRDFVGALSRTGGINIISELKKASPSRGVIRQEYAPAALAASLEEAGATALVLCVLRLCARPTFLHAQRSTETHTAAVLAMHRRSRRRSSRRSCCRP